MTDEIKLKPCPFCGGEAEIISDVYGIMCKGFALVTCKDCGAKSDKSEESIDYCAKQVVADKWNRRANNEC